MSFFWKKESMEKNQKWLTEAETMLDNFNKKIILIGGASTAGKTYKCKLLKKHLEGLGKRCLVVSLDNFYKPLSERIVNQTLKKFAKYREKQQKIVEILQKNTKNLLYDQKFSSDNYKIMFSELMKIIEPQDINDFMEELKNCYKNINFDIPSAIDFKKIINQIYNKKFLVLPEYSFKTSEVVGQTVIDKSGYDYIIFEGIFALCPNLIDKIDKKDVFAISLKCDLLTMLSRRLHRDIVVDRRTRSPKQTFESFFEQVLPCYFKYIEPSLKNADLKVNAFLTQEEVEKKPDIQNYDKYKFEITDKECRNIKINISCDKYDKPKSLIFEYILNGKIKKEVYDLKNLLEQDDICKLLNYFEQNKYKVNETKKNNCNNVETI